MTHLVAVWNPSIAADAMDAHVGVLLDWVRRARASGNPEDAYVWWGRVRSANRQGPLPHLDEVLALDEATEDDGDPREIHLYLTDYRSLYVGHVGGITADDMRLDDPDHMPAYYVDHDLVCDCWFELWDLRRIVQDDTLGVVAELRKLRNIHYHDRPVSIYGGMVDLPLMVRREDDIRFFDPAEREQLLDGGYWVEFDARHGGAGEMERELRDNLLGATAWASLDHATRTFIATAERVFRDNRSNPAFDFGPVIGSFSKALETEVSARLRAALRRLPRERRLANLGGATVDLLQRRHFTLGELVIALQGEQARFDALRTALHHGDWFTGQLPPMLEDFRQVRNPAVHEAVVPRDVAIRHRDRLLGVGSDGVFTQLSRVRPRSQDPTGVGVLKRNRGQGGAENPE